MTRFRNKFGLSLFYLICTLGIEIMTFCLLDIGILPKNFMYDFSIVLMFVGIIFIIPNYLAQYIVSMIMITAQFVLMYVNYSLFHLYGDVFSFDMIRLFNETKQAITSDFTYVWLIVVLVALLVVIGVVGFFIYRSLRVYKMPFYKNFSVFMIMILLVVQGLGLSVYTQQSMALSATADINDENYVLSDAFLRDTTMLKIASLKSLGTYGYYMNNIINLLSKTVDKAVINQATNYFNSGEIFDETSSNVFGVAEDENVLVVMMESLEWYGFSDGELNSRVFSSELTPNIYNLMCDGVVGTDFFAKSKTNISEGIGIMGSYPIGKYMTQVATSRTEDYFGFTLPNILSARGYDTGYYHAHDSSFFDRGTTLSHVGFDHLFFGDDAWGYTIQWQEWAKESDFVWAAIEEGDLIPEGKKFYNFYTSLTTHGSYKDEKSSGYGDRQDEEYRAKLFASTWYQNAKKNYSDDIEYLTNYMLGVIGLDEAIGVMVQTLKARGIYDDTTIILYSDHNAYYESISNTIKQVSYGNYSDTELNTIPLIIKSKGLTDAIDSLGYKYYNDEGRYSELANLNGVLGRADRYGNLMTNGQPFRSTDRFCSAYDIVPTLLDLLGISYNTRIYPGNSLFAELDETIKTVKSWEPYSTGNEYVVAYYSHTGGVYGKYGNTKDMDDYDYTWPDKENYGKTYPNKFKTVSKKLLLQLNYVATFYSYGTYRNIDSAVLGDLCLVNAS